MIKLFLREVAEQQGYNMSEFQRASLLPMSTVQRYWHSLGHKGEPIKSIDLRLVDHICEVLDCEPGDLLRRVKERDTHYEPQTTHT